MKLIPYSLALALAFDISQVTLALQWRVITGSLPAHEEELNRAVSQYVAKPMRAITEEEIRGLGKPNREWLNTILYTKDDRLQFSMLRSGINSPGKFSRDIGEFGFVAQLHAALAQYAEYAESEADAAQTLDILEEAVRRSFEPAASLVQECEIVTEILANYVTLLGSIASFKLSLNAPKPIHFDRVSESFQGFEESMRIQKREAIVDALEKVKKMWQGWWGS